MSDQQQENEITTTQAAPAAPVASDQVAAPAQTSALETPKAATAEKAVPATGEEAAPAKPKRTRRTAKPAADGEEVTKSTRYIKCKVAFDQIVDGKMKECRRDYAGFEAQMIQHMIDHCQGKLV